MSDNPIDQAIPEPTPKGIENLRTDIITVLKTIYDPEIPVNIYELGLIYHLEIDVEFNVKICMTLTTPGCPFAQTFPGTVEFEVKNVNGVNSVEVELVWDPPWTPEKMSEDARLALGMF